LAHGKQARLLVLVADERRVGTQHVAAVRNDHDIGAFADVVLPAIEQRPGRDLPAGLLADLAHDAVSRVLMQFQLPAGQFPLIPLVFQEQDPPGLDGDALDRHRERARGGMGGYWHAYFHRPAGSFLITARDPTLPGRHSPARWPVAGSVPCDIASPWSILG
jgi:hypothetical protein